MKVRKFLLSFGKLVALIVIGFTLGFFSSDLSRVDDWLSSEIIMSEKTKEISDYYRRVNESNIQIQKLRLFSKIRRRQLGFQEQIIQQANNIVAKANYGDFVKIGPAEYEVQQIMNDITIREIHCQILISHIREDEHLIGVFESSLASFLEIIDFLEEEMLDLNRKGEIVKAQLAALLSDTEISSKVKNYFFLPFWYRLSSAEKEFHAKIEKLERFCFMDFFYRKAFSFNPVVIPDIYWLEPFFNQEEAKKLIRLGIEALEKDEFSKSLDLFKKALEIDSENEQAVFYISLVWIRKGMNSWKNKKYEEAVWCFNQSLELEINCSAMVKKGICLVFLGNYQEALSLFDKALNINKDNQEAILAKAHTLMFRNQFRIERKKRGCTTESFTIRQDWLTAACLYGLLLDISKDKQVIEIALSSKNMVHSESKSRIIRLYFLMIDDQFGNISLSRRDRLEGIAANEISQTEIDSFYANFVRNRK